MRFPRLLPGLIVLLLLLTFPGCTRKAKIGRALNHAGDYYKAGELEKARVAYLAILRIDPRNPEAIKKIGLIYAKEGVTVEAIRFLGAARDLDPKDLNIRTELAEALIALRQFPAARKEAEAALGLQPENADALRHLAETVTSPEDIADIEQRLQKLNPQQPGVLLASGVLALRKQDLPAAETALGKAVAASPNSNPAHFALGNLWVAKKDLARAEQEFKQASTLSPRSSASLAYGQLLLQKGEIKAAADFLEQLSRQNPDYVPLWTAQARVALDEKEWDRALAHLDHVFAIDYSNLDARILQAQTLQAKGEIDKAIVILKQVNDNEIYSKMPGPKFELARAYLRKGLPGSAITSLNEAIKLQPNYSEAILLLAQVKLQQGDSRSVVDAMKHLLESRPGFPPAQVLLARAYQAQGDLANAEKTLREQTTTYPAAAEPHVLLGLLLRQEEKREEARAEFEAARKLTPKNLMASYQLVELDLAEKKIPEALQRAEALVKELPENPGPQYVLARVYLAQGKSDEAEAALKKSIELDPKFMTAYDLLVSIYVKTNRLERAKTELETFIAQYSRNTAGLLTLAAIEATLKNFDAAGQRYRQILDLDPNSARALNNLAVLSAENFGDLNTAFDLATRARTVQPEDASIADTLGWIDYQRKDYARAVALLQESVAKQPENITYLYHFGMANYMAGNTDAALAALTKAAAGSEDFKGKSDIPRAIELLKGVSSAGKEFSAADLQAILKERPGDTIVLLRLATLLEKQGETAQAAALWEEAFHQNPKAISPILNLARLYAGPLNDPTKALDFARKAREAAPDDAEIAGTAGRAAFHAGDFSWAYGLLRESAARPTVDAATLHDFAWTAYNLGKVAEARATMQRAAGASPDPATAKDCSRFLALTAPDEKPAADAGEQAEIQEALKADPQYVPALMRSASLQTQAKQKEAAIGMYEAILKRLPAFSPAQRELALLYSEIPAKSAAAFELANAVRKIYPNDPDLARTLGVLRYRRKEYDAAIKTLKESATTKPLDAVSLFALGMASIEQKQKTEGFKYLEDAVAAGLNGPDADEAASQLVQRDIGKQ